MDTADRPADGGLIAGQLGYGLHQVRVAWMSQVADW